MRNGPTGCPRDAQHPMEGEKRQFLPQGKSPAEAWEHVSDVGEVATEWPIVLHHTWYWQHEPGSTKARKAPSEAKGEDAVGPTGCKISSQSSKRETPPIHDKIGLVFYESDSKREDDPMVNGIIIPMTIWVEIHVPSSGIMEVLTALLDSGCTRCLISLQTLEKLRLRLRKLRFSQLDGSLTGGHQQLA